MSERTLLFYTALSHTGWGFAATAATVAVGVTLFFVDKNHRVRRDRRLVLAKWLLIPTLCAGLWLSVASIAHVGCAVRVGRRSHCSANMKQMGAALAIYVQDHDDMLPPAKLWRETLRQNLDTAEPEMVLICPDSPFPGGGYAVNRATDHLAVDRLDNASTLVYLFDAETGLPGAVGGKWLFARHRHFARANFLFADGHAKWDGKDRLDWLPEPTAETPAKKPSPR